jgi:bacteriocin biosynthesis cyclodehydratase domain-containing protein
MLLPGLVPLWRGPRSLQFGLDPRRAVILDLPNPAAAAVLGLLDGRRTEAGVLATAQRRGIDRDDARALLDTLRRHKLVAAAHTWLPAAAGERAAQLAGELGALALTRTDGARVSPADLLRRRSRARVRVTGRGRLGPPIAVALAAAGIGHVEPLLHGEVEPGELALVAASSPAVPPPSVTRARHRLAARAIGRLALGTRVDPLARRDAATFVVQVGPPAGPVATYALAHRRIAHLPVTLRDGTAVIGPLVRPGGQPCLHCVELHRADRDPAWPVLAAQLATPDASGPWSASPVGPACAVTTTLLAAGFATATVLRYIDRDASLPAGSSVEISRTAELRRRTWDPHPACPCARRS